MACTDQSRHGLSRVIDGGLEHRHVGWQTIKKKSEPRLA
jgi:hypothetical protein